MSEEEDADATVRNNRRGQGESAAMGYGLLAEGTELEDPVRFNQLLEAVMLDRL